MATIDIRKELIEEIQWVEDFPFLEGLLALVKQRSTKSQMKIYQLSPEQAEALDFSMKSMDEGNFSTHEEANAEIEKWLEE
jgi:hypothetical protein